MQVQLINGDDNDVEFEGLAELEIDNMFEFEGESNKESRTEETASRHQTEDLQSMTQHQNYNNQLLLNHK